VKLGLALLTFLSAASLASAEPIQPEGDPTSYATPPLERALSNWWINTRGGLYAGNPDDNAKSDVYHHESFESYFVGLSFHRVFKTGPIFLTAGGEVLAGRSVDRLSSSISHQTLVTEMKQVATSGGVGWQPKFMHGFGGLIYLSLPILAEQKTKLVVPAYQQEMDSTRPDPGVGLVFYYAINRHFLPTLMIESHGAAVITLGMTYGF
jgi:hypothetical protein